ncbi:nitrate- and nitrite sensing domain-containing protein [Streptomyces griseoluteus]|uniref:nitrate- and nitrite sensing domain-containing protein n=1 Tax=Streptomyces griseoluteus TaxID=29306 RepID=UPI00380B7655
MQGRFKRDGSASAEPEPHGGTDRGSSHQHAQSAGKSPTGDNGERGGRPGASAPAGASGTKPVAPAAKTAKSTPSTGSRMALRNWRISTRLVSLLALPVVAATTLGGLRIGDSMDDIKQLDNMKLLTEMTQRATELAAALQEERDQSAGPLAHGLKSSDYTVKGFRDKTDNAKKTFEDSAESIDAASKDGNLQGVRDTLVGLVSQLDALGKIRRDAYSSEGNSTQTVEAYHRLITQLIDLSQDMAEASSNPEMIQRTRALAAFSTAKEYASVQRAVIAAALPASNATKGNLSTNDRLYGEAAYDSEGSELNIFRKVYASQGAEEILKPIDENNPTIQAADLYAKRVFDSRDGLAGQPARSYLDWVDDSSTKIQQMKKIEHELLDSMEQKARELKATSEQEAIFSGVLILLVLGVSLVGAFVVARSMIRSLRRLQDTATKVAQDRLPELVKQLSESDPQDVDTSVESVGVHSRDEIGKVAAAFDEVHHEAVRLAAEQALLRGNVNAMFTNLSRRSQGLIQRQLSLISELESREADPDQLSSLFKLDHLATRMRRNGENLLVLAGEEPGRRWTRPVPLVDVLRAAASEVEQYERIELASVPSTEVAGRVVNDLVHLLAELLENATSFSSPQTKVKVTGHALPDGRVLIEIHDTGIGLSPEDLAAINERLAAPPTVDVSVSRRMGLFVVGRLSQRHGIRIQLRPSDSGGTTALVMLPVDVAQGGKKPAPGKAGGSGSGGGPAAAQAAAGAAAARRNNGGGGGALGGAPAAGGRLTGGPGQRGQVGAGQGPRAALPGTGQNGGRPGGPGGARGPQGPGAFQPSQSGQQNRPAPAGQGPAAPQGMHPANPGGPQQDAFGGRGPAQQQRGGAGAGAEQGRQPQLPPRGGPRAELPGGNPASRASLDVPRGHDEQDPSQTGGFPRQDLYGAGDQQQHTGQFARPGANGAQHTGQFQRPGAGDQQNTGQYQQPGAQQAGGYGRQQGGGEYTRPDLFGGPQGQQQGQHNPQAPQHTGQFPVQQGYDAYQAGHTGQQALPGRPAQHQNGDQAAQNPNQLGDTGQFEQQRPAAPQRPARQAADNWALPPAPAGNPGDGRTPLYDTLETNWFQQEQQQSESAPVAPQQPQAQAPTPAPQQSSSTTGSWRTSPNDELVRQAERVRQPAAGGVTTSGLPRRVPKANLVPGTAQQQQHHSGPQVSRAPDDVRGRLTNLRRGIAQGRQAGGGQTGSFPSPTHQQER